MTIKIFKDRVNLRLIVFIVGVATFLIMVFVAFGCSPVSEEPINKDEGNEQEETTGTDEENSASVEDMDSEGGEAEILFEEVELAGQVFKLELALDDEQRALGLMWREYLAEDEGMLFVFPDREPYPSELGFWMKNCLIPIDVIFIDRDGFVTAIHEMQPPEPGTPDEELPGYYSDGPAQFAIEIRGGLATELGLQAGDYIEFRRDYLVQLAR